MIGRPIQLLFPPDRIHEEALILTRIRSGERVDHYETIRRRKDGSDFPVSVTISPIRDASGEIVGASKIIRDISEQHAVQKALREAKSELERLVAERTTALSERDLLLREVYHRVKNNLQIIDGVLMLHLLKMDDAKTKEVLIDIQSRIFAIGLVHQQLMGSSDLKTFDIAPFLRQLLANIIGGAADERIKLTVDAPPLIVGLDFAVPLGLLVTELVTNAIKHAFPDGAGHLSVALRPDGRGRAVLLVSDNGQGSLGDSSAPQKTGLGASIINGLVAQLEGVVAARCDTGTTVEILLPLPETS
jgi:two-component sensor histidine kinase